MSIGKIKLKFPHPILLIPDNFGKYESLPKGLEIPC